MAVSSPALPSLPRRSRGPKPAEIIGRVLFYIAIAVIFVYTIFPFYWAIVGSITPTVARYDIQYIPTTITFDHYVNVFTRQAFGAQGRGDRRVHGDGDALLRRHG